jgi:hypothetical protein
MGVMYDAEAHLQKKAHSAPRQRWHLVDLSWLLLFVNPREGAPSIAAIPAPSGRSSASGPAPPPASALHSAGLGCSNARR